MITQSVLRCQAVEQEPLGPVQQWAEEYLHVEYRLHGTEADVGARRFALCSTILHSFPLSDCTESDVPWLLCTCTCHEHAYAMNWVWFIAGTANSLGQRMLDVAPQLPAFVCRGAEQHCAGLVISGMQQPQVGASVRGEGWLQLMPGQCVAFPG
jgi:hypothetical protein